MAWIESHEELPTHPKTRKVARALDVSIPTVIGHMHVLWYWCLTHAPDGRLEGMDPDDVADAAGWTDNAAAFTVALVGAGWLDDDGGTLVVHDWWEGAGKTIKRRKFATTRQRRARKSQPTDADVTPESHDSHADVTRDTHASHGADRDRDRDKKPKTGGATRLPDGWEPEPEPELIAAAGGQRVADRQLAIFRDYWPAQPGSRGRKADWQATWRNWLRRAGDQARGQPVRASPRTGESLPPAYGSDEFEKRRREREERADVLLG